MNVLCFGSLNIDYTYSVPHFVKKGETLSSTDLRLFAGGKGLNQSIALARAGLNVSLAGAIGEDGRFLLAELHEAGVDTRWVDVLPGMRTGHAIIQNDAEGDNCILVYGGANHCTTREQIDRVLTAFGKGDVLTLQNEIRELDYLIRSAKAKGLRVALTPAPMNEAVEKLPLELIDYLFLNEVECASLLHADAEADPIGAAQALREKQHPAKRSFQALRIAVNDELGAIADTMEAVIPRLNPGGRLCVITFHSLEDRIVKVAMAEAARGCTCPPEFPVCVCGNTPKVRLTPRKPMIPSANEISENPRARSAKLRVCEKC